MKIHRRKDRNNAYYVRVKDELNKWHDFFGGYTEQEACEVGRKYQNDIDMIKRGLTTREDLNAVDSSRRPIAEILVEYKADMVTNRRSEKYIKEASRCVQAVIDGIKAKCLADIQPGPVGKWLAGVIKAKKSARTHNGYLRAIRALMNWAAVRGLVRPDVLRFLKQQSEHTDRREESRALTFEEFDQLIESTPDKMRQLYYLFSGRCGLRWSEVFRLEWEDINLNDGRINLRPEATKSQRGDVLDIPPDLLGRLRVMGKGKGSVFSSKPILRTFKADLQRAGISYEVDGKQADRKCLRKTFCTHLVMRGVPINEAMKMMRHKDPALTLNIYTELGLLNTKASAAKLSSSRKSSGLSIVDAG